MQILLLPEDTSVKLWDVRRAKSCLVTLTEPKKKLAPFAQSGGVNGIIFTPDGLHLLTYRTDGFISKWELSTEKKCKIRFGAHENLAKRSVQMDVSCGGREDLLFVPSNDEVHVLNVTSGVEEMTLHAHYQNVNACVYSPHYQKLYSAGSDSQILSWEPQFGSADEKEHENGFEDAFKDAWTDDEDTEV